MPKCRKCGKELKSGGYCASCTPQNGRTPYSMYYSKSITPPKKDPVPAELRRDLGKLQAALNQARGDLNVAKRNVASLETKKQKASEQQVSGEEVVFTSEDIRYLDLARKAKKKFDSEVTKLRKKLAVVREEVKKFKKPSK